MSFEGRTIIVTGGAKGIGRATVEAFHEEGASVVILDTDEAGADLADTLGQRAFFVKTDVSREEEVVIAMQEAVERFGGIRVLVNNAAIQYFSSVTECSVEEWDKTFAVNLRGGFLCAKYAIPFMQKEDSGVVINVSSVQAFVTQSQVAAYASSKAAQIGLTRSIAIDYAPRIRSVAVCPGSVDTPLLRGLAAQSADPAAVIRECEDMHLVKRIASPSEIAGFIVYLASDKASFITGEAIRIDGGLGIQIQGSKK